MNKKTSVADFATKSDLNKAIKGSEKFLRAEILRVEEKVERVEEKLERVEGKIDQIATTLDGFVGTVDDLRVNNTVGTNQIHELDKTTKNQTRITKLESPN